MTIRSVALVGSFRKHYDEVVRVARVFEAAGIVVNTPPISRIVNPGDEFVRFECDLSISLDYDIQDVTLDRILQSDLLYVVAPEGYVGRTTSYELGCARLRRMPVYFSERPRDLPIFVPQDRIIDPTALASRIASGKIAAPSLAEGSVRGAAMVTVDIVILTIRECRLNVLLVVRGAEPFRGKLALPGGFSKPRETLEQPLTASWLKKPD